MDTANGEAPLRKMARHYDGVSMKIVGIGLNKTGTKTLRVCLRYWGLKHVSCNKEAFKLWRDADYEGLLAWVAKYDSFEDWPWPLLYKEIDGKFPGTKFILTRRKDAETWFRSLCRHALRSGPTEYRKRIYGHEMPHGHKAEHIQFYENHLNSVRDYFRDRPADLLEVCWEEGDGWDELSQFLGFERPDIPFPHANKSPDVSAPVGKFRSLINRLTKRLSCSKAPAIHRNSE